LGAGVVAAGSELLVVGIELEDALHVVGRSGPCSTVLEKSVHGLCGRSCGSCSIRVADCFRPPFVVGVCNCRSCSVDVSVKAQFYDGSEYSLEAN